MKRTPRKNTDLRLKIAIIESRRTQRRIAVDTRIGEGRLSEIVGHRGVPATDEERERIAKYLNREIADLFPVAPVETDVSEQPADDVQRSA